MNYNGLCGNYEKEIAEMLLEAFDKAIVGDIPCGEKSNRGEMNA